MNHVIKLITAMVLAGVLYSCSEPKKDQPIDGRWYTQAQLKMGKRVFTENCAMCHEEKAESTPDWKQTLADGSYPAPPLNGSAHAWHHSLSILLRTINQGGSKLGGKMPGFEGKLTEDEKMAAIAFFQSFWNERFMASGETMGI